MSTSKLTQLHVYIIGAVTAFILGLGLYFILINPVMQQKTELETRQTTADGTLGTTPEAAVQAATEAKAAAEQAAAAKAAGYQARIRAQSPPARVAIPVGGFPQKLKGIARWWQLPEAVRREAELFARGMPGVEANTYFQTFRPGPDPRTIPDQVVVLNLGSMTARGSFPQVMRWARRWNGFRYNPAVDSLNLQLVDKGQVLARANLTIHIWTTAKPTAGAAAPAAAPAGGAPGETLDAMPAAEGPGMPGPPGRP